MVWLGSCVGSLEQKLPKANGAGHRRGDDEDLVSHPVLDLQRRGGSSHPSVVRRRRRTRAAIAIEPIAQHPDVMSGFATPSSRDRKSHGTPDANVDAGRKQR